jgi:adenylyltransferase/sulfurtransferase
VNPEQRPSPLPEITPLELKERLDGDQPLLLVDVREAFEREIADLPDHGQRRIPLGELPGRAQELDRDRPLVLYCRTGSRSAWAARFLQAQGFEAVWNLSGGVMRWREEIDPTLQAY